MSNEKLIPALGLLIPIISVTVSLGALIVWIVVWHRRRMHEVDARHQERMAAIEKGLELPPESLPPPEQLPPRSRYLLFRGREKRVGPETRRARVRWRSDALT